MAQAGGTWAYVVVGGGIYGAAVAWELASTGASVCLLEAETIASGASGGLGKRGVRANGRDVRELPLMRLAYEQWPTLADRIGASTGYERMGSLHLFEEETAGTAREGWVQAESRQWLQEQHGIPTRILNRADVRNMEPQVSESVIGALYCPLDGIADHTITTRALADAARRHGAEVREHTPATGFTLDGDRVIEVQTSSGTIGVGTCVLLLANTAVPFMVRANLGITLPVWQMLPLVIRSAPLDHVPFRHLIGHESRVLALKVIEGNRVMISGGWHGRWNEQTGRGDTVQQQVEANVAEAIATYPALAGMAIEEADASRPESVSIDGIPIIDTLPGARNMLFATGWSGHGFAISIVVAKLLAEWVLAGVETGRPKALQPFAYSRFLP